MCGGRFDEAIFGRYLVWIVERGWFCWRGYTNWSLISKCICTLGGVHGSRRVLDESWKTDWKIVVEREGFCS